jgi:hypothetical protein
MIYKAFKTKKGGKPFFKASPLFSSILSSILGKACCSMLGDKACLVSTLDRDHFF